MKRLWNVIIRARVINRSAHIRVYFWHFHTISNGQRLHSQGRYKNKDIGLMSGCVLYICLFKKMLCLVDSHFLVLFIKVPISFRHIFKISKMESDLLWKTVTVHTQNKKQNKDNNMMLPLSIAHQLAWSLSISSSDWKTHPPVYH